ncbi:hypothetical protein TNCV_105871 [Trichonephila clavipes]|nr:hypothetical protein TNCV_105871 [Trichonephila clavipes]
MRRQSSLSLKRRRSYWMLRQVDYVLRGVLDGFSGTDLEDFGVEATSLVGCNKPPFSCNFYLLKRLGHSYGKPYGYGLSKQFSSLLQVIYAYYDQLRKAENGQLGLEKSFDYTEQ